LINEKLPMEKREMAGRGGFNFKANKKMQNLVRILASVRWIPLMSLPDYRKCIL
jgi:hypothetical protein